MTFIRSDNVFLFQLISLAYVNVPEAEGRRFHLWPQQLNENKAHPFIHSHCTCFWSHESQAVSSSCVSPTNMSTWASPLRADLHGNSSVVEPINSYHKYLKWQSATRAGCDLLLWPFSVFPFCFFFSPLSLCHQAEGLKEGDYLVAVGDTECKWLGVSDVMKLLKDVDEEGVNVRVVSVLDSSSQPMVTLPSVLWLVEELYWNIPLKKYRFI